MSSWRDYAHKTTDPLGCAKSAISAESPPVRPVNAPIGTNGTNGTLPDTVSKGLVLLVNAPAPRLRRADVWPQVVNDALRLASEGWADQALKLGWTELDLFGAVTDEGADSIDDGLAAWLEGRTILALCDRFAVVDDGNGARSYFYRGGRDRSAHLWDLGRE